MTIGELEEKLSKYSKNTELYAYDGVWDILDRLSCIEEDITYCGDKRKRILILKSKG